MRRPLEPRRKQEKLRKGVEGAGLAAEDSRRQVPPAKSLRRTALLGKGTEWVKRTTLFPGAWTTGDTIVRQRHFQQLCGPGEASLNGEHPPSVAMPGDPPTEALAR